MIEYYDEYLGEWVILSYDNELSELLDQMEAK